MKKSYFRRRSCIWLNFPATKSELIEEQGWKVFDLTETEHVHASILLEKLPDGKYGSIEEVMGALKSIKQH